MSLSIGQRVQPRGGRDNDDAGSGNASGGDGCRGVHRGIPGQPGPVHREHRLPGNSSDLRRSRLRSDVVDPERLHARLRGVHESGGPARRPIRPPSNLPVRPGGVHAGLSRVRAVRIVCGAGRRPCRSGPGRGDADAEFARAAAGRRPGRPACRCGQHLVGSGGNGGRTRTSRWRISGRIILALDLFRQRAGRAAGAGRRPAGPREDPRYR